MAIEPASFTPTHFVLLLDATIGLSLLAYILGWGKRKPEQTSAESQEGQGT